MHFSAVAQCGADEREMMGHVMAASARIVEVLARYVDVLVARLEALGLNREALVELLRSL